MRTVYLDLGPLAHLSGKGVVSGKEMTNTEQFITPDGMGIVVENGCIESIQHSEELREEYGGPLDDKNPSLEVISLHGRAVIPGFVDGHTHLLWAGDRSRELSWKRAGKTYQQISTMGGGIQDTVRSTQQASDDQLLQLGYQRVRTALRSGTTHMEAKSGYGLNTESELRLLEISNELQNMVHLPSLDITWLGAHDIPAGMNSKAYLDEILSDQLPNVLEQGFARSADVFCEPGWFDTEESEQILVASRKGGLELRMHVDEFQDGGGGELAAELNVDSADHSHYTSDETRLSMKDAGVMTGFLPGTPYSMGDKWPDFNHVTELDVPWSIATDFNPNCKILSPTFLGSLLVQRCSVDPLSALLAVTRNPSETTPHPTGKAHGRIEVGAVANFNVLSTPYWESWCLQPAHPPIESTCLNGKLIHH